MQSPPFRAQVFGRALALCRSQKYLALSEVHFINRPLAFIGLFFLFACWGWVSGWVGGWVGGDWGGDPLDFCGFFVCRFVSDTNSWIWRVLKKPATGRGGRVRGKGGR